MNPSSKEATDVRATPALLGAEAIELPTNRAFLSPGGQGNEEAATVELDPDPEVVFEHLVANQLCEGLPVIPPTEARVQRMLAFTDREPDEIVGLVPPRMGVATVLKVAINAVMAGCKPEYFPVVLTALEAALEPKANLRAAVTTTYVSWPVLVINGPVRLELDINCGWGVLSSGFRANATIGRAMTLLWRNLGGARTGGTATKPQGSALSYTPVIGEFEEESGWEPLHVERGFATDVSTVTVFADYGIPDFIYGQAFGHPTYELYRFAQGLASLSYHGVAMGGSDSEPMLLFNPNHSRELAQDGWTKDDVKRFFYENARNQREKLMNSPFNKLVPDDIRENTRVILTDGLPKWAREMMDSPYVTHDWIPIVQKPENFTIVCAGGPAPQGGKLLFFRPHAMGERSVTKPITLRDGTPVKSVNDLKRRPARK